MVPRGLPRSFGHCQQQSVSIGRWQPQTARTR